MSEIKAVKDGRAGSGRAISEMDSGHQNKKIGFKPKTLRQFSRILCVANDPHIYIQREHLCARNKLS